MSRTRLGLIVMAAVMVALPLALPGSAWADVGDISVGGVWVCRITQGAAGLTVEQRARQINQRITEVLSRPSLTQRQIVVEVRPAGRAAAIIVAGITVLTVTPEDVAGTGLPPHAVANQWAGRLARGLGRALPGRDVSAQLFGQPPQAGTPPLAGRRLTDGAWQWRDTQMNDGTKYVPDDPRRYTVQFFPDGRVAVRADCNRGTGTYQRRENMIEVAIRAMTRAACPPGSLEQRFVLQLNNVSSYFWRGELLHIELKVDSGTMTFTPVR